MATSVAVTALRAREGDALLVVCMDGDDMVFAMLVDGGRAATEPAIRERLTRLGRLDLLVVSHIDLDHIEGAVRLLRNGPPVPVGEVWFNGLEHLHGGALPPTFRDLAPSDGVALSAEIKRLGIPWNRAFAYGPVSVPREGAVVRKDLGPVTFHLLSPDRARLDALTRGPRAWLADAEPPSRPSRFRSLGASTPDVEALAATPDRNDAAAPNGTSIAFVMEYGRRRLLLTADAHPRILAAGLRTLGAKEESPLPLDLVKPSHHGSRENTTSTMSRLLACGDFLFSGDGLQATRPHDEAIAKVIGFGARPKRLAFNYRHAASRRWDLTELKTRYAYEIVVPEEDGDVTLTYVDD